MTASVLPSSQPDDHGLCFVFRMGDEMITHVTFPDTAAAFSILVYIDSYSADCFIEIGRGESRGGLVTSSPFALHGH